jgi:tRNA modification GTPase
VIVGETIAALASGPGPSARALIRISGPDTHRALHALAHDHPPDAHQALATSPARHEPAYAGDLAGMSARGASRAEGEVHARTGGRDRSAGVIRLDLGGGRTLPALVMRWWSPASFTGEDAAELLIPGNPVLVERVLARLREAAGVREATAGEFAARAFLARKLTLDRAEGLAAMIAAGNDAELAAARRVRDGQAGRVYAAWAEELAEILARVEVGIDFVDAEDVKTITSEELRRRLGEVASGLDAALGHALGQERADWRPVVALAGRPNAGKSTLFNALLGRARAIESPQAGTTRDALREVLPLGAAEGEGAANIGAISHTRGVGQRTGPGSMGTFADLLSGHEVMLTDLAGTDPLGDRAEAGAEPRSSADATIDARAQELARARIAEADAVLWCDPTGLFEPEDRPRTRGLVIRVRTMADRAGALGGDGGSARPGGAGGAAAATGGGGSSGNGGDGGDGGDGDAGGGAGGFDAPIAVCALDGWNIAALKGAIARATSGPPEGDPADLAAAGAAIVLPRHRRAMLEARERTRAALGLASDEDWSAELVAGELRAALDAAGELTGRLDPDAIIGRVFARFCIGK